MQAGTTAATRSTGSKTLADLVGLAAERYGEEVVARQKVGGAWRDVTYAEVGERVREIAVGLVDFGARPGEHLCILSTTRVEWTYCDFAIASASAVVQDAG